MEKNKGILTKLNCVCPSNNGTNILSQFFQTIFEPANVTKYFNDNYISIYYTNLQTWLLV